MPSIKNLYSTSSNGPPDGWPWKGGPFSSTQAEAEQALRRAVSKGKMIPAPRTVHGGGSTRSEQSGRTNLVWEVDDGHGLVYVGANVWDGWPLIWTSPVYGQRADALAGDGNMSSKLAAEYKIDPWSDEIDDYASAMHWITPDALARITGEGD